MHWSKTAAAARFNLATSGLKFCPIQELQPPLEELELNGPNAYGFAPLQQALAQKWGVAESNVVAAQGTSMANHLAMAVLLRPGDGVAIETPGYELLADTARYLGASVRRFRRRFEEQFRLNGEEIEKAIVPKTRLIIASNLHNPTGALATEEELTQLAAIAGRIGARVLVDEVYLDAAFPLRPRSAFHLGEAFVTTNSLTKVYGLNGLRCGWALADAKTAEQMWRLNNLFGVSPPFPAEQLSLVALKKLDQLRARSERLLQANHAVLNAFLDSRNDLEVVRPAFGTVVFPRWPSGDVETLCQLLKTKFETSIVPGRFFGAPDHFRIGIGGDTEMLAAGLERLGKAMDECGNGNEQKTATN